MTDGADDGRREMTDGRAKPERVSSTRWIAGATLGARLVVAGIFLWAAVGKFNGLDTFARDIANYHLLPESIVGFFAVFVPVTEVSAAAFLLTGFFSRGAATVAATMLLSFTFAMIQATFRGINIDCGCFGSSGTSLVGPLPIARNVGLILLCIWIATRSPAIAAFPLRRG